MRASSYPKVYNLGHSMLGSDFLLHEFVVQEKVDGSQFSFGMIDGKLCARSKNQELDPHTVTKEHMFFEACQQVLRVASRLPNNVIFCGEYLRKPKHNTLQYESIPKNHIVLFDMMVGEEDYRSNPSIVGEWAEELDFDVIPVLHAGHVTKEKLDELMQTESYLGGPKIEGVVLKQYVSYCPKNSKLLFAKVVSESFREKNKVSSKNKDPGGRDIVERLGEMYRTEARWKKAVQHLRDNGALEGSPKDIGPLLKELSRDFVEECKEEVKEALWQWAQKDIRRQVVQGFPEWYRQELQDAAFDPPA